MADDGSTSRRHFVSLGMFIIDEFSFADEDGNPTGKTLAPQASPSYEPCLCARSPIQLIPYLQIGGGGTYAVIGARMWLPPSKVGMIVDRGHDFPGHIQEAFDAYGPDMWLYRDDPTRGTTRALNAYRGEHRGFEYLTPRVRITPRDLSNTKLAQPDIIHFICSPSRAAAIISDIEQEEGWSPTTVYEPIPDRCVPEELPALQKVLPAVSILSPNAEEALSMLSMPKEPTKELVEEACSRFLDMGVGPHGQGSVIIRSGAMGACVASRGSPLAWVDAYWSPENSDKVVEVTGAGNSFLGGLGAGLVLSKGDVRQATLYATVSASFTIEQEGLPRLGRNSHGTGQEMELWNGDSPHRRLQALQDRLAEKGTK
ncbi:Ribokinase-like protein [Dichomitus squalens]|uniref:Ribokinase-like protein n=1 Tax=Dichomitus squalens TaxID=114155 RepID=A0A4Q9PWC9_9APHY|nr:Ribokinase-like protein [Dichomitus squalens]TBU58796.1 Ribokinase-like protein [Dichomitus squalens]